METTLILSLALLHSSDARHPTCTVHAPNACVSLQSKWLQMPTPLPPTPCVPVLLETSVCLWVKGGLS